MRRFKNLAAAFCCALAIGPYFAGSALAQTLATLQGVVADDSKLPVPGVTVKVTNTETGYTRNVFTDTAGLWRAPSLQTGLYSIEASLQGMQTVKRDNIKLLVGQVLDIDLTMGVETMSEAITVTAEAPVVEVSRSSAAKYVTEEEIVNLPIAGRDFVDFALLQPTVKNEPDRGGISLSGQRGTNSGLKLDGAEGKSAFFGYGRGGEATENDGLVVSQDSVKEFQVITNGFAPEFGQNGGGYVNVVTKSGTNDFKGTGFFLFRNQDFVSDLPLSPLNEDRGNECRSDSNPTGVPCAAAEFERINWGASIGGPIIQDKTHFFLSYDQLTREEPRNSTIPSGRPDNDPTALTIYEAINQRFPEVVQEYVFDPASGEARAQFNRAVDNLILFGKIDHQLSSSNSLSVRYNYTDYELGTPDPQSESAKPERTDSFVAQLVTLLGSNAVNELRFHYATDSFERRSNFERGSGAGLASQIDFSNINGDSVSVGKAYFFPIFTEEKKFQIQDNFSYLFGNHDLKFGFDYQSDNASQYFAGYADGRYQFNSIDAFLNDTPNRVRIFYGDVNNPNFDETQSVLGIYAQDSWKVNSNLTLNFGLRWDGTFNPQGIPHLVDGTVALPDGSTPNAGDIPNDLNNIAPRLGFAYSLGEEGKAVIRGGAGLFYSRTPILLWAAVVTSNGLAPGVISLTNPSPDTPLYVPIGEDINNTPLGRPTRPAIVLADPDYQDPETWRFNLGYEREVAPNWSAGLDLVYAHSESLQSNNDLNRELLRHDDFGRPIYTRTRPSTTFDQVFVRTSPGYSNYLATTISLNKRFSNGFQAQAHYTYSVDRDTDDSERTATTVTITDITDIDFDYGTSTRDIPHRFVLSGIAELPLDFKLSGAFFLQSGRPWSIVDPNSGLYSDPNGFFDEPVRAVVDGELVDRNSERNDAFSKIDLRLSKFFDVGQIRIEGFGEVFNLFNSVSFDVDQFGSQARMFTSVANQSAGVVNPEFGVAGVQNRSSDQRQIQVGARISF